METFNFGDLFIPTKLANTDYETGRTNNSACNTYDRVFLDAAQVQNEIDHCTDYAVMCGAYNRDQQASYWYRTGLNRYNDPSAICCGATGRSCQTNGYNEYPVIRPVMHVNVDAFLKFRNHPATKESDTQIYQNGDLRQVTFGLKFPSEHVDKKTCLTLDCLHALGKLDTTDATYFSYHQGMYGGKVHSTEYRYLGERYVRTTVRRFDEKDDPFFIGDIPLHQASVFADGTKCPATGRHTWAKVQPIYFNIRNWEDLPQSINPHGTGKANYMDVIADRGILAMPLALRLNEESPWQNCVPRAYLNGYNLYQELDRGNGNRKYKCRDVNHDFSGHGFLYEASQILRKRCQNIYLDLHPTTTKDKLKHLQIAPSHIALCQKACPTCQAIMNQEAQDLDIER